MPLGSAGRDGGRTQIDGRWEKSRERVKHERRGEERKGGRRHAVRLKDGWKERKQERLWEVRLCTLGSPCRPDGCQCSTDTAVL